MSKVSFYSWPATIRDEPERIAELQKSFGEIIRDEDYVAPAQGRHVSSSPPKP